MRIANINQVPIRLMTTLIAAGLAGICGASHGQNLDAAEESALQLARCLESNDTGCIEELTHPYSRPRQTFRASGLSSLRTLAEQYAFFRDSVVDGFMYFGLEVGSPASIEVAGDFEYVLVPYTLKSSSNWWYERHGYWIGVSENYGRNWRFIEDTSVLYGRIEDAVPGYQGQELPEVAGTRFENPGPAKSKYLVTKDGAFTIRDGEWNGYYELRFNIRKKIKEPIPLLVVYENPEDPQRPYVVPSFLAEEQEQLHLVSPVVKGLKEREIYNVFVIGFDAEDDEIIFEHYQPMLFYPVARHNNQPIPAIANMRPRSSSTALGMFGSTSGSLPPRCLDPNCQFLMPADAISGLSRLTPPIQ